MIHDTTVQLPEVEPSDSIGAEVLIGLNLGQYQTINLRDIDSRIQAMKREAEKLKDMAGNFPALDKNMVRILASIKMLELNISDIVDFG